MIQRFFALLALLALTLLGSPAVATASYNPSVGVNCTNTLAANSAICSENTSGAEDPISGHHGVVLKAVNIISYIAGAAAIILIIVSGLRFVLSSGDSNAVSGAKSTLINALIGLVVIVLARALITFIINQI